MISRREFLGTVAAGATAGLPEAQLQRVMPNSRRKRSSELRG